MANFQITCVRLEHPHRHIISADVRRWNPTAKSYGEVETMTVEMVRSRLDAGDNFETYSPSTGKFAKVRKFKCKIGDCGYKTIKSEDDAIKDNNLDNMSC